MNAGAREEKKKKTKKANSRQYVSISISNAHTRVRATSTPSTHTAKNQFSDSIMYCFRMMMNRTSFWAHTHTLPSTLLDNRHPMANETFARNSRARWNYVKHVLLSALWSRTGIKCWIDFHRFVFRDFHFSAFAAARLSQQIRRNEFSCWLLFSSFVARCEH